MDANVTFPPPGFNTSHPPMQCVYAISGTYGVLPRCLYYVTLVFAIFGRTREWLIIGALVSALTYAGTSAIHVMALVSSKKGVYDLDIPAAWSILSTGALAYIGIIHWSSTVRFSRARVVLVIWGVLVGTSLVFGRAELFDTVLDPPEPACYSSRGLLLQSPADLISPDFDCTYACFSRHKPMRHPSETVAVPRAVLTDRYSSFGVALIGPIQFAAYAALSFDSVQHNPSQLCTAMVLKYLDPARAPNLHRHIYDASAQHWYGGYFALLHFVRRQRWSWRKCLICGLAMPWMFLGLLIDVFCMPLMLANIVLNEITLQRSGFPVNETNNAVGQWGPIVNSLPCVAAALINKGLEVWERARAAKRQAKEEEDAGHGVVYPDEAPDAVRTADVEKGKKRMDVDEMEVGVVKPKLEHVETLMDMENLRRQKK